MILTEKIMLQTKGHGDTLDITSQVARVVAGSTVKNGLVTIFIIGSTAAITTIEFEPNLVRDFLGAWDNIAPENQDYHHDKAWGDNNGYAHIRASILGPSLMVPFKDGELMLGTWQQIVAVDFDNRPRERQVVIQIMGES